VDQLARIGIEIYSRDMKAAARKEIVALLDRIGPAISRQKISSLTEDYYLCILEELEPSLSAAQLLTQYRRDLAQALAFEPSPLSDSQISETLNQSISYLRKDLAILIGTPRWFMTAITRIQSACWRSVLSRIHSAAAAKLHLADWEKMIGEKLQILDELYERVDDRVRTAQSQTLEV
jgi:hypothetical protein